MLMTLEWRLLVVCFKWSRLYVDRTKINTISVALRLCLSPVGGAGVSSAIRNSVKLKQAISTATYVLENFVYWMACPFCHRFRKSIFTSKVRNECKQTHQTTRGQQYSVYSTYEEKKYDKKNNYNNNKPRIRLILFIQNGAKSLNDPNQNITIAQQQWTNRICVEWPTLNHRKSLISFQYPATSGFVVEESVA